MENQIENEIPIHFGVQNKMRRSSRAPNPDDPSSVMEMKYLKQIIKSNERYQVPLLIDDLKEDFELLGEEHFGNKESPKRNENEDKPLNVPEQFKQKFWRDFQNFLKKYTLIQEQSHNQLPEKPQSFYQDNENNEILSKMFFYIDKKFYEANMYQVWDQIPKYFSERENELIGDPKQYYQDHLFHFERFAVLPETEQNSVQKFVDILKINPEYLVQPMIINASQNPLNDQLMETILQQQFCVIREFSQSAGIDQAIFSIDRLCAKYGEENVTIINQAADFASRLKDCDKSLQSMSTMRLDDYCKYLKESSVMEPKCLVDDKGFLKYAINIGIEKWQECFEELNQKVPRQLRFYSETDCLRVLKGKIEELNYPKLDIKVENSWVGGHEQTLRMRGININHGPDDCHWYSIVAQDVPRFQELVEQKYEVDIYKEEGSWFCDVDFCIRNGIQVNHVVQRPGDMIYIGVGCISWLKSTGISCATAWNFCPKEINQLKIAWERNEVNKRINTRSVIPIKQLTVELLLHEGLNYEQNLRKYLSSQSLQLFQEDQMLYQTFIAQNPGINFFNESESYPICNCSYCREELFNYYAYCTGNKPKKSGTHEKKPQVLALCLNCYMHQLNNIRDRGNEIYFYHKFSPDLVGALCEQIQKLQNDSETPDVKRQYQSLYEIVRHYKQKEPVRTLPSVSSPSNSFVNETFMKEEAPSEKVPPPNIVEEVKQQQPEPSPKKQTPKRTRRKNANQNLNLNENLSITNQSDTEFATAKTEEKKKPTRQRKAKAEKKQQEQPTPKPVEEPEVPAKKTRRKKNAQPLVDDDMASQFTEEQSTVQDSGKKQTRKKKSTQKQQQQQQQIQEKVEVKTEDRSPLPNQGRPMDQQSQQSGGGYPMGGGPGGPQSQQQQYYQQQMQQMQGRQIPPQQQGMYAATAMGQNPQMQQQQEMMRQKMMMGQQGQFSYYKNPQEILEQFDPQNPGVNEFLNRNPQYKDALQKFAKDPQKLATIQQTIMQQQQQGSRLGNPNTGTPSNNQQQQMGSGHPSNAGTPSHNQNDGQNKGGNNNRPQGMNDPSKMKSGPPYMMPDGQPMSQQHYAQQMQMRGMPQGYQQYPYPQQQGGGPQPGGPGQQPHPSMYGQGYPGGMQRSMDPRQIQNHIQMLKAQQQQRQGAAAAGGNFPPGYPRQNSDADQGKSPMNQQNQGTPRGDVSPYGGGAGRPQQQQNYQQQQGGAKGNNGNNVNDKGSTPGQGKSTIPLSLVQQKMQSRKGKDSKKQANQSPQNDQSALQIKKDPSELSQQQAGTPSGAGQNNPGMQGNPNMRMFANPNLTREQQIMQQYQQMRGGPQQQQGQPQSGPGGEQDFNRRMQKIGDGQQQNPQPQMGRFPQGYDPRTAYMRMQDPQQQQQGVRQQMPGQRPEDMMSKEKLMEFYKKNGATQVQSMLEKRNFSSMNDDESKKDDDKNQGGQKQNQQPQLQQQAAMNAYQQGRMNSNMNPYLMQQNPQMRMQMGGQQQYPYGQQQPQQMMGQQNFNNPYQSQQQQQQYGGMQQGAYPNISPGFAPQKGGPVPPMQGSQVENYFKNDEEDNIHKNRVVDGDYFSRGLYNDDDHKFGFGDDPLGGNNNNNDVDTFFKDDDDHPDQKFNSLENLGFGNDSRFF